MSKLYKNWAMHNLVGHPLMEILNWFGLNRWARRVHDSTLPLERDELND